MTDTKKVLVKEKLAPEGISYLKDQGFEVDIGTRLGRPRSSWPASATTTR